MGKVLSFDSVINLIKEGGYGTYRLYLVPGSELLGGSHLTEENKDSKWTPDNVIEHLQGKMEYLGTGNYMLKLKRSNSTPNTAEVTYRFNYTEEGSAPASNTPSGYQGYQGLSGDKLEDIISKRVEKALSDEREKSALRDQMKELHWEMKQLKARRRGSQSKEGSILKGLMDLGKIAAVTVIAEKYPKSVPLVEKTLSTMGEALEEEDDDEEDETGFTPPER